MELDAAISACVEIASSAQKILARFRRQRNSALPVGQLPTELLTTILRQAVPRGFEYYQDLREVALVSRRWADIIWYTPSFWTVVVCDDSPATTALALRRSRGRPLDVKILCRRVHEVYPNLRHHHNAFTDLVERERSRWRSLTLDVDTSAGMERYLGTVGGNLREVHVRLEREGGWGSTLFDTVTAPLEVLSLSGCRLLWTQLQLPHLHSLALDRLKANRAVHMNDIVQFISSCPKLETLKITDCEMQCDTQDPSGQHSVHDHAEYTIARLKSLHIAESPNAHHLACRLFTPNCTS